MENQNASKTPKTHRIASKLLKRARDMRRDSAPAEALLWRYLRNQPLAGLKFRRQVGMGAYIADFYCAQPRIVIELDGASHLDRVEYDEERTRWLEGRDIKVVRFLNHEVFENIEGVLLSTASACGKQLDDFGALPSPQPSPCKGEGVSA